MGLLVIIAETFLLALALFLLVKATSIMIRALNNLSRSSNVELFVLTGFFSAVATSLPELFVSVTSAVAGKPNLALGVVLGSNIADVTLVIGLVAMVGGGISVVGDFIRKDVMRAFGAVVLPLLLLIDGNLTRLDGLLLILTFLVYHITVFSQKNKYQHQITAKPFAAVGKWLHTFNSTYQRTQLGWFIVGIIILLFAADVVVQTGTKLALDLGISMLFVGLFIIAVGTSLPEVAFELRAIKKHQFGVVLGDLLGSLVANSTLILGVTAIVAPITLFNSQIAYFNSVMIFLLGFFLLWSFMKSKLKITRLEGLALVGVYAMFVILEMGVF